MLRDDAIYLAGLMDGEGTIGIRPRPNGCFNIELGICMTSSNAPDLYQWLKSKEIGTP